MSKNSSSNGPSEGAEMGPPPADGSGQLRRWGWVLGGLGLPLLLFFLGRPPALGLSGTPDSWTELEQKQVLAEYLNRRVKLPGYKASCVQVAKKENYWSIARTHGISIDTLVGLNPDLSGLGAYVGRPLLVANQRGVLHFVRSGESVAGIEKDYGARSGLIRESNRLGWIQALRPGQVLLLPGVKPRPLNKSMAAIYDQRRLLRSPLAGHYSSLLGTRVDPFTGEAKHHNGVDIKAPFNSLVAASADGTVTLAGWNGGFGKCVVIEHGNGLRTLYGHLNTVLVHTGQKVKQYHYIGRVGSTGRTTGPHLHFTIWKDGKLQDPLKYLW